MTRRTYRKTQITVSLFPFLAVLICMMGALIVLLVLVVQQARVYATVAMDDGPTAEELDQAEELNLARQDHQWRREILDQQRLEMTKKQADHRLELSHLEDHIRRLEEKWIRLQAEAKSLTASAESDVQSRENASEELARLRQTIGQAQQQLDEAKLAAEQHPRSFAIIPYRGPHGTQRRPIFIECTARGIVLQPEGLVITGADLSGPLGPGNPLDAALRATREYLVANGVVGEAGEPYPLLVVRPDGTEAYGAARNAMKTWDDEFGYELIEADVQLEYPAADPALRELIIRSLADARQRQAILAAAMPSQFGGPGSGRGSSAGGGLVATHRGGFVPTHQAGTRQGGRGGTGGSRAATGQSDDSSADPQQDSATQNQSQHAEQESNPQRRGSQTSPPGKQPGGQGGTNRGGSALGAAMGGHRGANWALPKASRNATGITRPVRVACWPDRLLILPDQGDQRHARTITVDNNLAEQIDEFVSQIWKHTDSWGLALVGGFWKPVVNVEVAPGGEAMFVELERLMEGSGLEVKRKTW